MKRAIGILFMLIMFVAVIFIGWSCAAELEKSPEVLNLEKRINSLSEQHNSILFRHDDLVKTIATLNDSRNQTLGALNLMKDLLSEQINSEKDKKIAVEKARKYAEEQEKKIAVDKVKHDALIADVVDIKDLLPGASTLEQEVADEPEDL